MRLQKNCTDLWAGKGEAQAHLGASPFAREDLRARLSKWGVGEESRSGRARRSSAQRGARPIHLGLHQARGTKPSNRICHRNRFTLEKPPCHRKPDRCVADVHETHSPPPCHRVPDHFHQGRGSSAGNVPTPVQVVKPPSCHTSSTNVRGSNKGSNWRSSWRQANQERELTELLKWDASAAVSRKPLAAKRSIRRPRRCRRRRRRRPGRG